MLLEDFEPSWSVVGFQDAEAIDILKYITLKPAPVEKIRAGEEMQEKGAAEDSLLLFYIWAIDPNHCRKPDC